MIKKVSVTFLMFMIMLGLSYIVVATEKTEPLKSLGLRATNQQWNMPTLAPTEASPFLSFTPKPTISPSTAPTSTPTSVPSGSISTEVPSEPTWNIHTPTLAPAELPSAPFLSFTPKPTISPSTAPTSTPTGLPSSTPTSVPSGSISTEVPSEPIWNIHTPTLAPAEQPSAPFLSFTPKPTISPDNQPTGSPSGGLPTSNPSTAPFLFPFLSPSVPSPTDPTPSPSGATEAPNLLPNIVPTPPGPGPFPPNTSILPIVIISITFEGGSIDPNTGELTATGGVITGTIGGIPFTTNILNFVLTFPTTATSSSRIVLTPSDDICGILSLELGPINVELLGLYIDTSRICLEITASQGGGLLADLLCGLSGGNLTNLPTLIDFVRDILTAALSLNQQIAPKACNNGNSTTTVCSGACEVLSLVIGPVDLFLLGVHVHIDNCENQAVRACVSATRGEGLLGDLLCGLVGQ